ncbi:hypothetical protein RRG08_006901 [Elysia crispata]|uniref:Uncharacterized protein n=1 Tax=Elysia crispata TaxID=231223 RepID=A0AAE1CZP8_9GAST|nr:hypothetical protein RRG08_006901 [Elysia crispata]
MCSVAVALPSSVLPHSVLDEALTVELHAKACAYSVGDSVAEISPRKGSPLRPWEIRPPFCCTVMIDAGFGPTINALAGRGVDGFFRWRCLPVASGFACAYRLAKQRGWFSVRRVSFL